MAQIHEASQTGPCNMGCRRAQSAAAGRGGGGAQKRAASRASGVWAPTGTKGRRRRRHGRGLAGGKNWEPGTSEVNG